MVRYEAGETLASIARTYDCSPPAISYVVSKSRARQPARDRSQAGPGELESQLIKGAANGLAAAASRRRPRFDAADSPTATGQQLGNGHEHRVSREAERFSSNGPAEGVQHPPRALSGAGNGAPAVGGGQRAPVVSPSLRSEADPRHRLHLPLGNGGISNNDPPDLELPLAGRPVANESDPGRPYTARPPYPMSGRPEAAGLSEPASAAGQPIRQQGTDSGSDAAPRKEGAGAFIDHDLRARVDTDIAAFLAAFDAALMQDTQENRFALREATDRLLRAGARTRIELERLEARVPLTAHDRSGTSIGAWRYR